MKHGMKIILALAASLAVLAGCEGATDLGDADVTTTKTITESSTYVAPSPRTTSTALSDYEAYELMEDEDMQASVMESSLLKQGINLPPGFASEYAEAVCLDLEDGVDPMNTAFTARKHLPMYDVVEHATMVGASVGSHCPEYAYMIEQLGE